MHFITNYSIYRGRFMDVVEKVVCSGVSVVQLSWVGTDKELLEKAEWVRHITLQYGVKMCVNNRIDIANAVSADYLHIGQTDVPINTARRLLSDNIQIGYTITSVDEYSSIADYYGVGPVFETTTKTVRNQPIGEHKLKQIVENTYTPVVAIGGIDLHNYGKILQIGCSDAAVVSPLYENDPKQWLLNANSIRGRNK